MKNEIHWRDENARAKSLQVKKYTVLGQKLHSIEIVKQKTVKLFNTESSAL